jgi:hypothetical protein
MKGKTAVVLVAVLMAGCSGTPGNTNRQSARKGPYASEVLVHGTRYTESDLRALLGRSMKEVGDRMNLTEARRVFWVDEPPLELRGRQFFFADREEVMLFLDESEPLFKAFSETAEWDKDAFLRAKVGGIRVESDDGMIDVGNVPWQWRPKR